jgi:hypothetical protein
VRGRKWREGKVSCYDVFCLLRERTLKRNGGKLCEVTEVV